MQGTKKEIVLTKGKLANMIVQTCFSELIYMTEAEVNKMMYDSKVSQYKREIRVEQTLQVDEFVQIYERSYIERFIQRVRYFIFFILFF